ncbi:MAG: dihydrodipicolinate synthase family protein [Pseudomonadota bacterium]
MTTYHGVWPVAPTPFHPDGTIDTDGMKRVLDCMIDQGVAGICILANFSEQFLLCDEERDHLTRLSITHIEKRVPVIVTISHFATDIVCARARQAHELGADMVMMMPPYHGSLLKATAAQTYEQLARVGEVGIPIMIQDAPLSGVDLPADVLARFAQDIEMVKLFKIECAQAATKIRVLVDLAGKALDAVFDGEEAITLLADLHAGAVGSMTSAMIPDQIAPIIASFAGGDTNQAAAGYARVLPAINFENRQCGFRASKVAMCEGGVIASDFCRHPITPLHPQTRQGLLELLAPLDPVVLRWGR